MSYIPKSTCYRVTPQRRIVLEELKKVCTHPTAQEVYELVQKQDKSVSLATVYRSLDFLVEQELVIKLKARGKQARYDADLTQHCHLVCKKCGRVSDCFDVEKLKIDSKEIGKLGFCPCLDYLEIPGLCRECCGC
ncbi:transcriptional repressor [Candidatus Peregrinibacteria bacterium]|jgi:Fur family transcriptional regulator, ferric uptake regulator|nr:transcriptional repressor [Candidatus Peregrinibacteria bacterium]MBT7484636.1 transcriptional repressor [Candidatus Peregrinibacteria bacterium]